MWKRIKELVIKSIASYDYSEWSILSGMPDHMNILTGQNFINAVLDNDECECDINHNHNNIIDNNNNNISTEPCEHHVPYNDINGDDTDNNTINDDNKDNKSNNSSSTDNDDNDNDNNEEEANKNGISIAFSQVDNIDDIDLLICKKDSLNFIKIIPKDTFCVPGRRPRLISSILVVSFETYDKFWEDEVGRKAGTTQVLTTEIVSLLAPTKTQFRLNERIHALMKAVKKLVFHFGHEGKEAEQNIAAARSVILYLKRLCDDNKKWIPLLVDAYTTFIDGLIELNGGNEELYQNDKQAYFDCFRKSFVDICQMDQSVHQFVSNTSEIADLILDDKELANRYYFLTNETGRQQLGGMDINSALYNQALCCRNMKRYDECEALFKEVADRVVSDSSVAKKMLPIILDSWRASVMKRPICKKQKKKHVSNFNYVSAPKYGYKWHNQRQKFVPEKVEEKMPDIKSQVQLSAFMNECRVAGIKAHQKKARGHEKQINGLMKSMQYEYITCTNCFKAKPIKEMKRCARCGAVYCDRNCQKLDWKFHKRRCKAS